MSHNEDIAGWRRALRRESGVAAEADIEIFPVVWPDFAVPRTPPMTDALAVRIESLSVRPVNLNVSLGSLRLSASGSGTASLRVAVTAVVKGQMQVTILRTFPREEARPAKGPSVNIPLNLMTRQTVAVELRIEGNQVGMNPPMLLVWASLVSQGRDGVDEATTVRRVRASVGEPDEHDIMG